MQKFEKLFYDALKVAQSKRLTEEQKAKFIQDTYGEYNPTG